jgi:predicted TPR repeat methyltransferase
MTRHSFSSAEFNQYAGGYDQMLEQGLAVSGEGKEYFARGRVEWLKICMDEMGFAPQHIMDYGCGTGMTTPLLRERFDAESVVGVDPSAKLIKRAIREYGSSQTRFKQSQQYSSQEENDLVYCNGVFHHIPIARRPMAAQYIWESLKPGGYFAFWENNPWNPGTRYVMSRIPFDRDAVTLTPLEARGLLQASGFHILRTDFLFIFPRVVRLLRWAERYLTKFPLGGQYLVLARKSGGLSSRV